MFRFATIAAVAATGLLIIITRWTVGRWSEARALRDISVSRDWLVRHRAQDRP